MLGSGNLSDVEGYVSYVRPRQVLGPVRGWSAFVLFRAKDRTDIRSRGHQFPRRRWGKHAGIRTNARCHCFRATAVTCYVEDRGRVERGPSNGRPRITRDNQILIQNK